MTSGEADVVREWLAGLGEVVLNVAGPRESQDPGTYDVTRRLLVQVLA